MSAPPAAVAVARPRSLTGAVALGAPVLGGVLYFLGYVGYGIWPCLLVFLVPKLISLNRRYPDRTDFIPYIPGNLIAGFAF